MPTSMSWHKKGAARHNGSHKRHKQDNEKSVSCPACDGHAYHCRHCDDGKVTIRQHDIIHRKMKLEDDPVID